MTITARGRTWALLALGTLAFGTGLGFSALAGEDLTDLRTTAERTYGAVSDGDWDAINRVDPDCDGRGYELDDTTARPTRTNFTVSDVDVSGNSGTVDLTVTYDANSTVSHGVAEWHLAADGRWRLAADGTCLL